MSKTTIYVCKCGCNCKKSQVRQGPRRGPYVCRLHGSPVIHYIKKCQIKGCGKDFIAQPGPGKDAKSCPECKAKRKHTPRNSSVTAICSSCKKEFTYIYYGGIKKRKCWDCTGLEPGSKPINQCSRIPAKNPPGNCLKCGNPRPPENRCLCTPCYIQAEDYDIGEEQVVRM